MFKNQKGQVAVEFSLILPLLFGVLFVVVSFAMRLILSEMTLYTAFMAGRVAAVGGEPQAAATDIMPGFTVTDSPPNSSGPGDFTLRGQYKMMPFLTSGGGALSNPLNAFLDIKSAVAMYRWPVCTTDTDGDNEITTRCP
ncbi:MAG: TadE family protein [Pseudomonadota bacterium]